jgi:hypothetical protein
MVDFKVGKPTVSPTTPSLYNIEELKWDILIL